MRKNRIDNQTVGAGEQNNAPGGFHLIKWHTLFIMISILTFGAAALGDVYINSMESDIDGVIYKNETQNQSSLYSALYRAAYMNVLLDTSFENTKKSPRQIEELYGNGSTFLERNGTKTNDALGLSPDLEKEIREMLKQLKAQAEIAADKTDYFLKLKRNLMTGKNDGGLTSEYNGLLRDLKKNIQQAMFENDALWLHHAQEARFQAIFSRLQFERLISGGAPFLYEDVVACLEKVRTHILQIEKTGRTVLSSKSSESIKNMIKSVRDLYSSYLDAQKNKTQAVILFDNEIIKFNANAEKAGKKYEQNMFSSVDRFYQQMKNSSSKLFTASLLMAFISLISGLAMIFKTNGYKKAPTDALKGEKIFMSMAAMKKGLDKKQSINRMRWKF